MRRWLRLSVVLLAGCAHGPWVTGGSANSSARSGESSQASANSSATSGQLSQGSAASSEASNNSSAASQASAQSSANSNQSSVNSSRSSEGSLGSTEASNQSSGNSSGATSGGAVSSQILVGSALLTAAAVGIVLTVYSSKRRPDAAQLQGLQPQSHQPVQRIPGPAPDWYQPPPEQPMEPQPSPQPRQPQPSPQPLEPEPYPLRRGGWAPPLEAMMLARAWFKANALQLKQDLALGAGPTLEDLAGIARIAPERRPRFFRLLQTHRRALLLPAEPTLVEAAEAMAQVGELVLADPVLRVDGEAVALAQ